MGKFNKKEVLRMQKTWREAKKELEFVLEYPPFFYKEIDEWDGEALSMDLESDAFLKIQKDFIAEVNRVHNLISESDTSDPTTLDPDVFAEPFSEIERKYAEELEEARLWMKRFPTEPHKATRKKLEG